MIPCRVRIRRTEVRSGASWSAITRITRDTFRSVDEITIRELRNHGGDVLHRVEQGETLLVTRAGVPVGELRPIPRPRLSATSLLARWRHVPAIEPHGFR